MKWLIIIDRHIYLEQRFLNFIGWRPYFLHKKTFALPFLNFYNSFLLKGILDHNYIRPNGWVPAVWRYIVSNYKQIDFIFIFFVKVAESVLLYKLTLFFIQASIVSRPTFWKTLIDRPSGVYGLLWSINFSLSIAILF